MGVFLSSSKLLLSDIQTPLKKGHLAEVLWMVKRDDGAYDCQVETMVNAGEKREFSVSCERKEKEEPQRKTTC